MDSEINFSTNPRVSSDLGEPGGGEICEFAPLSLYSGSTSFFVCELADNLWLPRGKPGGGLLYEPGESEMFEFAPVSLYSGSSSFFVCRPADKLWLPRDKPGGGLLRKPMG